MKKVIVLWFCCLIPFFCESGEKRDLKPYLLPQDHPAKPILDKIFKKSRALTSLKTMMRAGFVNPKPRKFTHLIVTRHPDLPGYVIKAYLDAQRFPKNKPEHHFWLLRIKGARMIEKTIHKYGWENIFKVPKKWIYPLPRRPHPLPDLPAKHYILIEEDMEILNDKENRKEWESSAVSKELLSHLYKLLEKSGLHDCAKPDNIPFSKDGKIAFIDTQTFEEWPVAYNKLDEYLKPKMRNYWRKKRS